MTQPLKPSTSNWIWLADLERYDSALLLGEALEHQQADLSRHFRVVHNARGVTGGRLPFDTGSMDCVCLDSSVLESVANGSGGTDVLTDVRRVVRAGGGVFLTVGPVDPRPWWQRLRRNGMRGRLRRAGFRRIRMYYVFPDHGYYDSVVPARGRSAAGYVVWGNGVTPQARLRRVATLVGGHRMSYSSWFYLAYP